MPRIERLSPGETRLKYGDFQASKNAGEVDQTIEGDLGTPAETALAISPDPEAIARFTFGIGEPHANPFTDSQPDKPLIAVVPNVLRNWRGTVWNLPLNTGEENKQLGINNMQGLIVEKFPEVKRYMTANREIIIPTQADKNSIREVILQRCKTSDNFNTVFGTNVLKLAFYFKGVHSNALRKALEPWGIQFKLRDFPLPNNFWRDLTKEEAIATLEKIFLEEYPEFVYFLIPDTHEVNPKYQDKAKSFIKKRIGKPRQFDSVFGSASLDKKRSPHFNGSVIDAMKTLFASLNIPFTSRDFTAESGIWLGRSEQECVLNMQTIWSESFPQFNEQFPLDEEGHIDTASMEEARQYILDKVGRRKKFTAVFSATPTMRASTPHFEGSFIVALRKTFEPWGIKLRFKDFRNELLWKDKTTSEILDVFIIIFRDAFPEFEDFLLEDGQLVEPRKRDEARKFILAKIGNKTQFQRIFGGLTQVDSSFSNSHFVVIKDAFSRFDIDFQSKEFYRQHIWHGKNKEEVLQISRGIFIEQFPQFSEQYLSNGSITLPEDLLDAAKKFILQHVSSARSFTAVFRGVPKYRFDFNGSHIKIIKDVFSVWGIEFKMKDFTTQRNFWSDKTEDEIVSNTIQLFIEEFPEVKTLLQTQNKESLKKFILSRIGTRKQFMKVFGDTPLRVQRVPYFNGSFITGVQKVFSLWNLEFSPVDFKQGEEQEEDISISPEEANKEFLELLEEE